MLACLHWVVTCENDHDPQKFGNDFKKNYLKALSYPALDKCRCINHSLLDYVDLRCM